MSITHTKVSAIADGADTTVVRPSDWNADHTIAADTITAVMMAASSVDLATDTVTGILPTANGGTGIAYFTAAGPTVARVYTFPDAAATILYSGGDLGTPSAGVATNLTGTAAGLTAGVASAVALGGITGLGTGVATALAVNVGSAGAPVVLDGALGTPSSGTGTNITGVNAATLGGATFAAPGTIGGGTPGAAT